MSAWAVFSVISVIYTILLLVTCYTKGIVQMIWPILLIICIGYLHSNTSFDLYAINGKWVPEWIFSPYCLFMSPILAFWGVIILRFSYK